MIWTVEGLMRSIQSCATATKQGRWVPARPINYQHLALRLKAAWLVLRGRADAVVWPDGQ
jgi:hypothetical protein